MTTAYVIFSAGIGIGILARRDTGFVFHAGSEPLAHLDGAVFRRAYEARRAIARRLRRLSSASAVENRTHA